MCLEVIREWSIWTILLREHGLLGIDMRVCHIRIVILIPRRPSHWCAMSRFRASLDMTRINLVVQAGSGRIIMHDELMEAAWQYLVV